MNIVQIELPYASDVIGKEYVPPGQAWALCAGLVDPKSRGTVRLASSNPLAKPVVTANFLSEPLDVKSQMAAIDLCRQLGNDAAFAPYRTREAVPGKDLDPAAKAEFVKSGATTFFHQVGTARMGKDDGAVVGADLKVKGIEGLRIVSDDLWNQVKARQGTMKTKNTDVPIWDRRRPKFLYSGLMTCGGCDGGFSKVSKDGFGCSTARKKGAAACTNMAVIK